MDNIGYKPPEGWFSLGTAGKFTLGRIKDQGKSPYGGAVGDVGNGGTISGTFTLLEPDFETLRNRLLQMSSDKIDIPAIVPQVMSRMESTFFGNGLRAKMTQAFYGEVVQALVNAFRELLPPWVTVNGLGFLRVGFELPMPDLVKLYVDHDPIRMQRFHLQGEPLHDSIGFAFTHDRILSPDQQAAIRDVESWLSQEMHAPNFYEDVETNEKWEEI